MLSSKVSPTAARFGRDPVTSCGRLAGTFVGGALFEFLFELACSKLDWSSVSPSFHELGVPARLVARLNQQGIASPFPIQEATIPDALAGRDVCGQAPTGSGKTIAFAIAVVSAATDSAPRRPRALVLVPTRELAMPGAGRDRPPGR